MPEPNAAGTPVGSLLWLRVAAKARGHATWKGTHQAIQGTTRPGPPRSSCITVIVILILILLLTIILILLILIIIILSYRSLFIIPISPTDV